MVPNRENFVKNSDNEYSDVEEGTPLQKPKPKALWGKVSKNIEDETKKKVMIMG